MTSLPPDTNPRNLFARLASILGLLGAALYFSGWIYRWAYYYYFQIDLGTLDFPFQSFLILPIQVFFGSLTSTVTTVLIFLTAAIAGYLTLLVISGLESSILSRLQSNSDVSIHSPHRFPLNLNRLRRYFNRFNPLSIDSFKAIESLANEIIIVSWIVLCLFWYAQLRGTVDAQRDAYHCTSTLSSVVFVASLEKLPIMRPIISSDSVAKLDKFGAIGDIDLFDQLTIKSLNRTTPNTSTRVWRLLLEHGRWIYLFPDLPLGVSKGKHPPILAIQQGLGDQLMILRPAEKGPECS